ncbi:syntaxin-binding protein 5-like isoform X13 [Branchiostoma floridae]|uniref:Syntaxin-binding protein 5-like isoform X13 n=1 Tax=Branchiostoma floridae TaxID=7739 RepID=A0A9J7MYN9_BRAFL|nr:syntaxin-binding protein 5-like isoform X13 [Branchiostoma floridae]
MKKFNFKKVLDGLTSSSAPPAKPETEITETLGSEHFQVSKTVRHGFPYQPTAMAYDPVQHILAIGCKSGSIRLFGRPGVDCHVMHDNDAAVLQLIFLVNEGALVSVCSDDSLHLWNLRQKRPAILHSLKYNRERITYCHLPFQSKWLYIGTERGNVHIANIESFVLSGYVINWNKAIELSQRTHPGPVVSLSDNPTDSSKLLIGFETGMIVQWDLKTKAAECRYACEQQTLHSLAWHHEGKQFMCSHSDGSLTVWNYRSPSKPAQVFQPHGHPAQKGSKPEACRPIMKVAWPTQRTGDPFIVFSDGLPYERSGRRPCITVMQGKSVTVLEMEYPVVNFLPVSSTPWPNDFQDPYAIIVLLENDLVVIDLTTPGYPCFQNPYPMDLHESPVTCCTYYADCPPEMIPAFYTVGSRQQKKTGFSDKNWPVKGGEWGTSTCSYPEIIITGHADGSLKFWDASAVTLQLLYKLRTSKIFEKQPLNQSTEYEEDPFAIVKIAMCCESRILCVAGTSGHVIVYRYNKVETTVDVPTLEIALVYEVDDLDSPDTDQIPPPMQPPSSSVGSAGSGGMPSPSPHHSTSSEGAEKVGSPLLKVKSGPQKMVPGYQVDLCAQLVTVEGEPPSQILCLAINSLYGLMAFGNMQGLAIVDIIQKTTLLNLGTPDLYGSADPYTRTQPRSPQRKKPPAGLGDLGEAQAVEQLQSPQRRKPLKALSKLGESEIGEQERCRSPTTERDESNGVCLSPTGTTRKKLADIKRNRNQPRPRMSKAHSTASMEGNGGDDSDDMNSSLSMSWGSSVSRLFRTELIKADSKDGSFSRSRSSSMSSLENVSAEGINCLSFTESYTRKTDPVTSPCLWVGTTLGSVLVIVLNLPPQGDQRLTQPVIVSPSGPMGAAAFGDLQSQMLMCVGHPSGTILRLKGAILAMSFLDCNGMTIPPLFAKWEDPKKKDENRETKDGQSMNQRRGWQQLQHLHRQKAPSSPTTETISDRQFVVICSEKQAKVISLPSQTCAYKLNITETSFVCKADVVSIAKHQSKVGHSTNLTKKKVRNAPGLCCALDRVTSKVKKDSVCLACFLANGHIMTFSLPSLRPLLDSDFLPLADMRIAQTFSFSNCGQALYLCTPSEIQRITLAADTCESLQEMLCELFLPVDTPEGPKQSFFKGLFSSPSIVDKEELFGEAASGKASRSVAKHIPGTGGIEGVKAESGSAMAEVQKARMALVERGEKLSELEERTEALKVGSELYASSAHQVMEKYKNKKWYQL